MLREHEQRVVEMIRVNYPLVTKEDALDRQLIGGTKFERVMYSIYYRLALLSYDIFETIVFWIPLGFAYYCYVTFMRCWYGVTKYTLPGVDPILGGTRLYEFGALEYVQLKIIGVLSYSQYFGWYRLICHKI
jgi:hypothetical protein